MGGSGMLVLFSIQECRVVRAVQVPHRVTSLAVVAAAGGPAVPPYLHPALLYYHGCVAAGLAEGRLLLVDLALDDPAESTDSAPAGCFYIQPGSKDLPRLRCKAAGEGLHLTLEVSPFTRGEAFHWDGVTFPAEEVAVTALHYSPQLASICLGYNTGTLALVSLTALSLDYSSPYSPGSAPVTHLAWQEPLDDPRHYSYYWAVRGDGRAPALATLYSLTYRERQWEQAMGPLYSMLEAVTPRWSLTLGGDPGEEEAASSQVLALAALELPLADRLDTGDLDQQVSDLGLVLLAWATPTATFLGLFDINCWYQEQMPSTLDTSSLSSYLSISPLDTGGDPLLDLVVDVASIAKFGSSNTQVEQHFQPSSLRFGVTALLAGGWLEAQHLGLQRKVLGELGRPGSLVSPTQLYQFCLHAGLAPGPTFDPSLLGQRRALLSVALEHSMVGMVVAAARDWADGSLAKAGCSLKFLLDWAWSRVAGIKELIDRQTLPLFDHSLAEVDGSSRGQLASLAGQLAQLVTVLSCLAGLQPTSSQGLEELEVRLSVTGLVLLYTQAISWFVSVGLLPEQPEGPTSPFPVSRLEAQYREKRLKLGEQAGAFGRPGLMVDSLCEDVGEELCSAFQRAGGPGSYPPPSLHALITTFLSEAPAPAKLRLVQYFFLDLAHCSHALDPGLVDHLVKFPSAFSLPPSLIKLTQAFWLLDHEDFEEAVAMMLDPLLQDDDVSPSHHRAVLVSLLAQGQQALALKYTRIRRPPLNQAEDVRLHISVLLANGAIQEAFTFQRARRGSTTSASLLSSFYRTAEELGKLDSVLQLSLSLQEEKEFVTFLQAASRRDSQEVLLMYYLQRARFPEAMHLNQQLGEAGVVSAARAAIMDRYNHILPGLAGTLGVRRVALVPSGGSRPVPLSVTLQDRNIRLQSHATVMEQRLATPRHARPETFTPFRRSRGVTGLLKDTTVGGKRARVEDSLISFPLDTTVDTQEQQEDPEHTTITPPTKRTRLSDVSSLNMSVKSIRRMSLYRTADALTILCTPPVVRRAQGRLEPRRPELGAATPQSILKVKQLMAGAGPAAGERPFLDVSLSLEDTDKLTPSRSREGTPGKSLRFREPRRVAEGARPPTPPPGGIQVTLFLILLLILLILAIILLVLLVLLTLSCRWRAVPTARSPSTAPAWRWTPARTPGTPTPAWRRCWRRWRCRR